MKSSMIFGRFGHVPPILERCRDWLSLQQQANQRECIQVLAGCTIDRSNLVFRGDSRSKTQGRWCCMIAGCAHFKEKAMTTKPLSLAFVLTVSGFTATMLASAHAQAPAPTPSPHMEVIHHPNYDKSVNMPFSPAIKIKSGKILWLAGTTALPVYHDHPHKRDQIQQYMVNDLEAQTRRAMDGIKQTLDASGASFKDVVHYFVFRARPRMGDIGRASAVIASYFAPFNHKPTSTNVAVLELGEPEQLIEIQMFAVVD
jgi:2-iminobutanoate/2-iminopropanoate deaminase